MLGLLSSCTPMLSSSGLCPVRTLQGRMQTPLRTTMWVQIQLTVCLGVPVQGTVTMAARSPIRAQSRMSLAWPQAPLQWRPLLVWRSRMTLHLMRSLPTRMQSSWRG